MQSFSDFINFWAVADVLVAKRVQLGDKLHKKHMLHLMSPSQRLGEVMKTDLTLLQLMPSRKHWVGQGKKTRYRTLADGEHRQRRATTQSNSIAIRHTIENDLKCGVKPAYLLRLEAFVEYIRQRIHDKGFALAQPTIFPDKKDDTSCRPLCKFENLEDAVIIILANRYLTQLFDGLFYSESLAFRCKRTYHGQEDCVTSHHDAIDRIKEYRAGRDGKQLYVSECDLQKFYDTVSHRMVRKCYYGLLKKVAKQHPGIGFDEINRVFEAYLNCYSYPRDVYGKNHCPEFWEENEIEEKRRCFKWVKDELIANKVAKTERGLMRMHIGVPQGGALSGLIANMVLNTVDWQVKRRMTSNDLYLRYCDDMIILSTSKARCRKLFMVYYKGTKRLNLVPHKAGKELKFGHKEFWKGKSKDAYLWAMGREDASEWIGFVGYEMNRDGLLRIRKKSFRNEIEKQREVVFDKVLNRVKGKDRVSDDSLYFSLENKLVSMSVGKISVWNAEYLESEMCWSTGFKALEMNPVVERQLRELDHHRGMILSAAARRIDGMKAKGKKLKRNDLKELEDEKNRDKRGMVHSYYYQFKKKQNIDTE